MEFEKVYAFAASFPSLATRTIARIEDLDKIAIDPHNGSGVRDAARFVLYVWTWGDASDGERFDLVKAWNRWDLKHRAAWQAWAADPWWG